MLGHAAYYIRDMSRGMSKTNCFRFFYPLRKREDVDAALDHLLRTSHTPETIYQVLPDGLQAIKKLKLQQYLKERIKSITPPLPAYLLKELAPKTSPEEPKQVVSFNEEPNMLTRDAFIDLLIGKPLGQLFKKANIPYQRRLLILKRHSRQHEGFKTIVTEGMRPWLKDELPYQIKDPRQIDRYYHGASLDEKEDVEPTTDPYRISGVYGMTGNYFKLIPTRSKY
jgi:hypothetical protein